MAIIFDTVRWKNFLSTGNTFTEINLNTKKVGLIVGTNGSGKSTLLDAITFGLFGKPFRKINKPQLVNSINGKDCIVEIDFSVNNIKYKVVRGIKPNVFEIYEKGKLVEQSADSKDYQAYLEEQILNVNYKSFIQVVILGSGNYIPFMQLSAADRRFIIEDLLDIEIFSLMNDSLKMRISELNAEMNATSTTVEILKERYRLIEKHIKELENSSEQKLTELKEIYGNNSLKIQEHESNILQLQEKIAVYKKKLSPLKSLDKKSRDYNNVISKLEVSILKLKNDISFFDENVVCPTCTQNIDLDFKKQIQETKKNKLQEILNGYKGANSELNKIELKIKELMEYSDILTEINDSIREENSFILALKEYNLKLDTDINSLVIEKEQPFKKEELEQTKTELNDCLNNLIKLREDESYYEVIAGMLKDTGIKTKIINNYIPVINKSINHYLDMMDFFISFEFDENFKEKMKSRGRDDFSYESFSEGEKNKIDLAILFAFRELAKKKNSTNTNLLIFDEVLDGSLDTEGTENFLKILFKNIKGMSVYIISHKDQVVDKFNNVIRFQKIKNFSQIV